jgi:ribosomal-protein-alanine N-acetyltransferase
VSQESHEATAAELHWIAPAAVASRVVEDAQEIATISGETPWRVRATASGDAALIGRWREHLDDCAVLGIWCAPRRVPALIADLERVAAAQGFSRLLGPLVPEEAAPPYLAAGLRVVERVVLMRLEHPQRACRHEPAPRGFGIRVASPEDLPGVFAVDADSFDDFWRYDEPQLDRYMRTERAAVATVEGRTVGYTLANVRGGEGSLGRLAVSPTARRRGVGRGLACDALGWLVRNGARAVTLSRQEHNAGAAGLYHAIGFRDLRGALVITVSQELRV